MGNGDGKKTVEQAAKDIIDKDVKDQTQAGRPGKRGEGHASASTVQLGSLAGTGVSAGSHGLKPAPLVLGAVVITGIIATLLYALLPYRPVVPTTVSPGSTPADAEALGDPCLAGIWRSGPLVWRTAGFAPRQPGGAGILVTFDPDGTETIDLSAAASEEDTPAPTIVHTSTFRGKIVARIATRQHTVVSAQLVSSTATEHVVISAARPQDVTNPRRSLAVFGLGGNPENKSYTVSETSLTYDPSPVWTMNLTRISPPPPQGTCPA